MDAALLEAHLADDCAALITLYTQAADVAENADAAAFFLTQAYVFALEAGHSDAPTLHRRLVTAGRDAPLGSDPLRM
ncbi:hypothetical protein Z945_1833 [Sulfitobacter noctilucae]|nr:hypothetical protein Z945_1833 [Sulfitobacter noctilucae]